LRVRRNNKRLILLSLPGYPPAVVVVTIMACWRASHPFAVEGGPMRPVEVFGIIVRVFGLSLLVYALWYLVYGVSTLLGLGETAGGYRLSYFISGFTFLILALYLLRGAPHIVRFSYPEQR
jgi:hypothetical protein